MISDLDNTLYDWVDVWYKSFKAMLACLVEQSGIPERILIPEFKQIHERHRTSEYAFSIQELPSLRARFPGEDLTQKFGDAIRAFRVARKASLRLYPGVAETLTAIKREGCLVVGYTESMGFYTNYRVRHLGLDGLLDFLYSPPDHELPGKAKPTDIRYYAAEQYQLGSTVHRILPKDEVKPNPKILLDIIRETGITSETCIYVGDSLMKDVFMAQQAGVTDVWARYGIAQNRGEYELLRHVTHWTEEDVEREKGLKPEHLRPSYILDHGLADLQDHFSFARFGGSRARGLASPLQA